jgi:hypothetical protein
MLRIFPVLLSLFFCTFSFLHAEERIASTLNDVDLLVSDLYNENGHNWGEKYIAINHNSFAVKASIKAQDLINAEDKLLRHTIIIEPGDRADLGSIMQKDLSTHADWKYEWQIRPDSN